MCTGACILYKVARVVLGENTTFVGGEEYLKQRGVDVVNLNDADCKQMMAEFIAKHPEDWFNSLITFQTDLCS
jgi:cytosine deaminase